jgi:folate-binding protein YgfZ
MISLDDYRRIRDGAGVVDRSAYGRIAVTGRDRASFLQGLVTNDVAALRPGTGCYAAHLTPQGRMITDLRLIDAGDAIVAGVEPGFAEPLATRFDGFIFTEDVAIANLTGSWGELGVYGPRSPQALRDALHVDPARLAAAPEYANEWFDSPAGRVLAVRSDATGEVGFDLLADRRTLDAIGYALAGAGIKEVGAGTFHVLRLEAGRPVFSIDMDEQTIPLEAGLLERAISTTKGCYVGQEVIVRVLHRGHGRVARRLVGLLADRPDATVERGAAVHAGPEPGRVTSAAVSPALGKTIALAYVHRDAAGPGQQVTIDASSGPLDAVVTALPFIRGSAVFATGAGESAPRPPAER